MNWLARNIIVVMLGALTSVIAVAGLVYLQAGSGQTLFGFAIFRYLPIGAIGAGMLGCIGYMAGSLMLRLRPAGLSLLVAFLIAACVVYMGESEEMTFFLGTPSQQDAAAASFSTYSHFLRTSVVHSPLEFWSSADGGDNTSLMSAFFNPGSAPAAHVASTGDDRVDGIGGGLSGMMASQDVSNTGPARQMNQMGMGIQSFGARVRAHSTQWFLTLRQTLGFSIGAGMVFAYLWSLSYCKDCMLLMAKKGEQTRYFARTREMQNAVDQVLTKARDRQLQESIQAHIEKGSDKGGNWTEYASTIEVERCLQCQMHRMSFRASRKDGAKWKPIDVLGFSACTSEPLKFA